MADEDGAVAPVGLLLIPLLLIPLLQLRLAPLRVHKVLHPRHLPRLVLLVLHNPRPPIRI